MASSKDDPREFKNESLRNCPADREGQKLRRMVEIMRARDALTVGRESFGEKLMSAIADAAPGTVEPLESFAEHRVKGAIMDYLRGEDCPLESEEIPDYLTKSAHKPTEAETAEEDSRKMLEFFSKLPDDLLTELPEAILSASSTVARMRDDPAWKTILSSAQQVLEIRDSTEEGDNE